jgi:ERF superfamily
MQRSSPSIASLAAALAKAQAELVNPEKSLVATIRSDGPRGIEQTFRYAPLSSGLDIVRKTLGQHEIATVQTTAIDQTAGVVNLTTVLAHASGEWIASDWPICALSETATPHRMGAALTYARRYALFTLVGIAGEDDLDAPDLTTPTQKTPGPEQPVGAGNGRLNGGQQSHAPRAAIQRKSNVRSHSAELGPEASAELRDRLVGEIADLNCGDDAALWAQRQLTEKNRLNVADAERVEEAFRAKLATFQSRVMEVPDTTRKMRKPPDGRNRKDSLKRSRSKGIDKTVLALPEPRRIRDREHVQFVAKQACLICGRLPSDAHHLRFAQSRALGRKVSDEFTVPLCRGHHREVHRAGDEVTWWKNIGVDPTMPARELWIQTHPLAAGVARVGTDADVTWSNPDHCVTPHK